MAIDVIYDPTLHLVRMVYQGALTFDDVKGTVSDIANKILEHKCYCVLSDLRESNLNMSTLQLFETPGVISKILDSFGIKQFEVKRAYVIKDHLEDFRFLENVMVNTGHRVRVFQDIDEAIKWLLKE